MNIYPRIVSYYRPYIWETFCALCILLFEIAFGLLKPWPLKVVVDDLLKVEDARYELPYLSMSFSFVTALSIVSVSYFLIHAISGALNFVSNYWLIKIGLRALLRMRTELYAYLQTLPLVFHDNRRSGDSVYRVAYDAQAIQTFFNSGIATVIRSGVMLIAVFVIMFQMNFFLTLISLSVVPLLFIAIQYFGGRIRRESEVFREKESDVLSKVSEGLGGIRIIQAFGRENEETKEFGKHCKRSIITNLKLQGTNLTSTLVVGLITATGMALMIYYGSLEISQGKIELGELLVLLAYLAMLYTPLEQLSYTVWALDGATSGAKRVFEILDVDNEIQDSPKAKELESVKGKIELQDVCFSYTPEKPVLLDVSLTVEPGQTVALVGGTGAGKTTILSLIPRFYDSSSGDVLIDGREIKDMKKASLRSAISIVWQDTLLVNGTVLDNISYGRPDASHQDIVFAAQAAQADDFIQKLAKGYETEVGERGVRLSGGQRQRIGLARAFLRQSPILLLDEPTSALDLKTEADMMESLGKLMEKKTTVIVTHRLTTVHHADHIYFMENGKVVESGTGPELMKLKGRYWDLWNVHSQGSQYD
ncbi:MAG: ABC transporter ATP-binding protein [Verrucomicrobiota bacterium]